MTCTHFFIDPIYFSDYIKLTFAAKAREIERKKIPSFRSLYAVYIWQEPLITPTVSNPVKPASNFFAWLVDWHTNVP